MRQAGRILLAVSAVLLLAAKGDQLPRVELLHGAKSLPPLIARLGQGGRPVVLHFFATWCGSCREETPIIREALARARLEGASTAMLSLDTPAARVSKVPRYLRANGLDAPTYLLDAPDPEPVAKLIDPSWQGDLPATFVFRDGKRVASFLGPLPTAGALDEAVKASSKNDASSR